MQHATLVLLPVDVASVAAPCIPILLRPSNPVGLTPAVHRKSQCAFPPSRLRLSHQHPYARVDSCFFIIAYAAPVSSHPSQPYEARRHTAAAVQRATQPHEKHTRRAERLCIDHHCARPAPPRRPPCPSPRDSVHQRFLRLRYTCTSTPHPSPCSAQVPHASSGADLGD
jgi:hypothetical protein